MSYGPAGFNGHYGVGDKGSHFAAWEQPGYLVSDLRATFRNLR